jgi:hypothetical protein
MEWKHKCDLGWLTERQKYLTASDIKSLIPFTKTGRPRKVDNTDYLKMMAKKQVILTGEDCWSYGAAARGHLLEPYAIDALNDWFINRGAKRQMFFHWDDELISLPDREIAFSPDALDIPQLHENSQMPTMMAEVKCYSPDRHIATAYTEKSQIEERWQIATGMALLDSIETAYLVLFNPSMRGSNRLFVIQYTRDDLKDEIATITKVETDWMLFKMSRPFLPITTERGSEGLDEADIIDELERAQRMNPV